MHPLSYSSSGLQKVEAGASSSSGSPKVAPPELQVDANATVMHAPHASHAPTEADPVLSAPDWQAASQLSQMSQLPLLPNGVPECSMFARSAMEPAESSMAGGPSALPSAPASEQGAGDLEFASLPSMHGAVESEMPSMHGAVDSEMASMCGDDGSESARLGGEDSLMMACPAVLGGIQGGPSALAGMLGVSTSLMGASDALGSMHGGPSGSGSRMGGDDSLRCHALAAPPALPQPVAHGMNLTLVSLGVIV